MVGLYAPALFVAFLVTVLEMTEVVALVFALRGESGSVRHGAWGAASGTTVVAVAGFFTGSILIAFPRSALLFASAVVLAAFAWFLFRSTVRSYRKAYATPGGSASPASPVAAERSVQFAGGFTVGVVESVETVIVLIALAAAGYGVSALAGAVFGGLVLVAVAAVLHGRIRQIKVPTLKLGATSVLFAFAVFWGGEAAGVNWPAGDLILLPLFLTALVLVRLGVGWRARVGLPFEPKG